VAHAQAGRSGGAALRWVNPRPLALVAAGDPHADQAEAPATTTTATETTGATSAMMLVLVEAPCTPRMLGCASAGVSINDIATH
jgi:hypothetical protein